MSINLNPFYTTNNYDSNNAGIYQISPNNSNLILRANPYNNIGLIGEIRLNTLINPPTFQGYTGNIWVNFNALQGEKGDKGLDFNNTVFFNNLTNSNIIGNNVELGNIFASTYANVSANISNINIRSIKSGINNINSNLSVNSLILNQNSNTISLTTNPIPYIWNFTTPNNTITYLKNNINDNNFYSWGTSEIWTVKQNYNIFKGQAVRLDKENNNLVIVPITYTNLNNLNTFITPFTMLGIATQNASSGNNCIICTKGITTVICSSNITNDFTLTNSINNIGTPGLVSKDSGIFCNINSNPLVDYINAGYFLENGNNIANNGNYILFYVNPHTHKN